MKDEAHEQALPRAFAIWGYFYGLSIPQALGYVFGAVEVALAACLFLGLFRTAAYGAAMGLHAVSVLDRA